MRKNPFLRQLLRNAVVVGLMLATIFAGTCLVMMLTQ
jgi:hypothetical protein